MENSNFKRIGIIGVGNSTNDSIRTDELYHLLAEKSKLEAMPIIVFNQKDSDLSQEEIIQKAKETYEFANLNHDIIIDLIKEHEIMFNKQAPTIKSMAIDFENRGVDTESFITQNDHKPFYATLRPSKHKKTNKKKRK